MPIVKHLDKSSAGWFKHQISLNDNFEPKPFPSKKNPKNKNTEQKDDLWQVGLSNCVYLWSAATSRVTKLCDLGPEDTVTSVSWTQRGNHLAVGTNKGEVPGDRGEPPQPGGTRGKGGKNRG